MKRHGSSLLTAIALILVLWFVLSRLHFVVWVSVPWWGLLLIIVVLFLAVDYILSRLFNRSQ